MKRTPLLFLILYFVGCSSQESIRPGSSAETETNPPLGVESRVSSSPSASSYVSQQGNHDNGTVYSPFKTDTTLKSLKASPSLELDSIDNPQLYIAEKLEEARQHYLAALAAQEVGDSTLCSAEFEGAIEALDQLSYLPGIDANKDFTDLSKNVVDDYEKYITSIDNLGPGASVFALREKLSQIIEKVDVSKVEIPKEDMVGTSVPLPFNEHVERNIAFFMGERGRLHFEKWLQLSGKFFPLMQQIFREEGVPEELTYLSMIESGLRPDARSWAKAVGLWQFMKGTGHLYGLRGNWWYDERRDFEKSTRAAARHMKDLYAEFGDWHLVLAAYNSGAGRVYGAIRRTGSTDFWKIRSLLPRETRNYVPGYIAVVRMATAPERYGFHGIEPASALAYDIVAIDDCVSLRVLAQCAETDVETLRDLNPELLQWCTPPGVTGYRLRVPPGKSEVFVSNYANVPDEQKRDWGVHTVRKGETISTIAVRYGLTTQLLVDVNNVKNPAKLSTGLKLAIPLPREMMSARSKVPFEYERQAKGIDFNQLKAYVARTDAAKSSRPSVKRIKSPAGKERLAYRVKRGDTIGHIAEWYGVRASDIRNWNDIPYGSVIQVNQEIVLWIDPQKAEALASINEMSFSEKQSSWKEQLVQAGFPGGFSASKERKTAGWIRYNVRPGDTLEKIARRYGVNIADLQMWNKLRSSKIIVGQSLEIFAVPEERTSIITENRSHEKDRTLSSSEVTQHHVKRGETLWQIAKMYGVTVQDLEESNDLGNVLKAGERITIPQR
ncbi:MAG: LysM peptidoglycan-binding domain-containing protein [Bacteroidota bacterium]